MGHHGNILLADDEPTFLEATKELLEDEGYDCQAVHNVNELSQALTQNEFDLLITDLNMPGNRVMETVGELRERSKSLPVIVVTGYPSVPSAVKSVRLNVLEYMIKPIDFPRLLEAVREGIHHKHLLASLTLAREESQQRAQELTALEAAANVFRLSSEEEVLYSAKPSTLTDSSKSHYFRLRESIFHTIQVLQKTKSAFRSKDLAGLRKYLETVLYETTETKKVPEDTPDPSL